MKTFFAAPVIRHGEKPAILYDSVHRYFDAPRLDVFARSRHPGFEAWGNQVAS